MLKIDERLIEKEEQYIRYSLSYPVIDLNNKFVEYINEDMYYSILSFKDVVRDILEDEELDIVVDLLSDFDVTFNDNNIVSIPIEFSQFIGTNNISYINAYNYDINLEKEIKLSDVFNKKLDYRDILSEAIRLKIISNYSECEEKLVYLPDYIWIDDEQTFYIEEDGLTLCFSGYELGILSCDIIEFKIRYENTIEYLSDYFIRRVLLKE